MVNPLGGAFDLGEIKVWLTLLLGNGEPSVLKELFDLVGNMPRCDLASFFIERFKPAYFPVKGTGQHIAGFRFILPGGAAEFLTALRAYEMAGNNEVVAHPPSPSVDEATRCYQWLIQSSI